MKILCLESLWDKDDALSVVPILEVLKNNYDIFYDVIRFFSSEDFFSALTLADRYDIIYIATHGDPGIIRSGDGHTDISLESISDFLSGKLVDKSMHIASCSSLDIEDSRIQDFLDRTGCSTLSGYKTYTYWVESASVDLIMLEWLITSDLQKKSQLKKFLKRYESLLTSSGLVLKVKK